MLSPESIMLASGMSLFLTAHISLTGHGRCSFSRLVSSPQRFHFGGIVSRENEGKTKWLLETLLLSFIKYAYLSLVVKLRFAFIYRKFHWRAGRRSLVQATSIDLLSKSSEAVSGWKPAGQSVLAPHSLHPCITLFLSSLP